MIEHGSTTREQIVTTAREYIGTPFHHQARLKGVGVDCAGLVVLVARELGIPCEDHPRLNYSQFPVVGQALLRTCQEQLVQIDPEAVRPGSILLYWVQKPTRPQHVAIQSFDGRMIHAWHEAGAVRETTIGRYWASRLHSAFDYSGVA